MKWRETTLDLWRPVAFVLLSCVLCVPILAQDQPAQFQVRVSTQLVVQTVSVTDKDGKPIEGLTGEDFIVTEDNVPQTISVFEFEKFDDTALPRPLTPIAIRPTATPLDTTRISPIPSGDKRYQNRRLMAFYFDMPSLGDAERFR